MPSIERIEQFHERLARLGGELDYLAERGESLELPPRPKEGLDDDLASLLSEELPESPAPPGGAAAADDSGLDDQDTSALLDNLDDLFADDEESGDPPPADDDPLASLDLGDDDMPVPPDFSFDPDTFGEDATADEAGDLDAFGETDQADDLDDLGDLDADDALSAFDEPAADDADEIDADDAVEDLGDLDADTDTDLDDTDDLAEPEEEFVADSPAPTSTTASDIDDLDTLDDLGDLGDLDSLDDFDLGDSATGTDADDSDEEVFGADFGDQLDTEFGETLGDTDELPAVDDDLSDDLDADLDMDNLENEGFSLGDFGEAFDIDEDSLDEFAGLKTDIGEDPSLMDGDDSDATELEETTELDEELAQRQFSDTEFSHIKQSLAQLPLNVRIATEETIGNAAGDAEQLNSLIDLLIKGSAPTTIADAVSKITGKRLQVPKGYRKRTGLDFEEEKRSFRYRFIHVWLPILRTAVLITVAVALVSFLGWRFVYRPIHAAVLYRQGYADARAARFLAANETFERAWSLWERPRWFVPYARAFVDHRQYDLAVKKYDQLVFGMDRDRRDFLRRMVEERRLIETEPHPRRRRRFRTYYEALNVDRPGILEHALLQSEILADYERAGDLYSILLFADRRDYDGLMGTGDNYLRWAEEDPSRYESARGAYADLMAAHGETDAILMRFLQFFVRTDNLPRVRDIVHLFEVLEPGSRIDPLIYADAAGFLLDRGIVDNVRSMLVRSYEEAPDTPEVFFHLARYSRIMQTFTEERNALDNARILFERAEPLSRRRLAMQIETDILSAEYWYERDELLLALEESQRAYDRYQEAKATGLLAPDPRLARLYALRGDVEYFTGGDFPRALDLFNRAAADGYETEELNFKRGFILYDLGRFDEALGRFAAIGSRNALDGPENLLWARGNTNFQRGNYAAAEATYRRLLRTFNARRDRIQRLLIDEDPEHRALIENLFRVNNNLGVTLYRQHQIDGTRPERFGEALNHLRISAEISENFLRDRETGIRPLARNLAFLNTRALLNPTPDFPPQIFQELPRTMDQLLF